MKKISTTVFILLVLSALVQAQQAKYRSGIFLHHSTGGCIWGPNGSPTSIPAEIERYNTEHQLSGDDAVTMTQTGWPETPWNNEWERWHRIFDNEDTADADIRPFIETEPVIVIKSCFPSSALDGEGTEADTSNPTHKTVANYKWHWRNFIRVMAQHPNTFFVVWTNAPLVAGATNDEQAALSDAFCRWAKDTLAKGLDPSFGSFPPNVYVFDFFHKLAGTDGKLPAELASSSGDSHPNAAATALVAPQFVDEIFNAAIAYESVANGIHPPSPAPADFRLEQNYPNPFNPATVISFRLSAVGHVTLNVYDVLGRQVKTLVNEVRKAGNHEVRFDGGNLPSGVYFYRLAANGRAETRKMMLTR